MATELSLEHVRDLIEAQGDLSKAHWENTRREMTSGFTGVHGRLDRLNCQVDKHGARLTTLEGPRLHQRARDDDPTPHMRRSNDGLPITRRDVAVGLACSGVSIGGLIWILQVIGKL